MANFDELLFEHRNQAYGAYTLRRDYRPTLGRAVVLGSLHSTCSLPSRWSRLVPEMVL